MKRVLKILLIIFIIISVAVAGAAIWQWKNIKSIVLGINKNTEEISVMRTENQQQLISDLQSFLDIPLREMTEEERKQVEEGSANVNEVYQKIFEERQEELKEERENANSPDKGPVNPENKKDNPMGSNKNDNNSVDHSTKQSASDDSSGSDSLRSKDEIVSSAMAKLYGLQNQYTGIAEATIAQGDQYYESIKKHDDDANARAATIAHFTPIVRGIEGQCDADVEAVLSQLKSELEAIGADTSIISSIRQTYASEKQLKLSYYSSMYLN